MMVSPHISMGSETVLLRRYPLKFNIAFVFSLT
jgi:hypothetical protein